MLHRHRAHIASTCLAALRHLEEIRRVITDGESPTGIALTPLPERSRAMLLQTLDTVSDRLHQLLGKFAPPHQSETSERSRPSATMMWVSILLRTVDELVRDLMPARMGKQYGALRPEEEERLQPEVEAALAAVLAAVQASDAMADRSSTASAQRLDTPEDAE